VNGEHFRAFVWLHWRLRLNQLRRGGIANVVLLVILTVAVLLLAGILFVTGFLVGLFALAEVSSPIVLYVWDGLVAAFLFFWVIGLITELQRSEAVSLEKFLHLPVSLTGAFILNYLSSVFRLSLIVFLPAMAGLTLGLICGRGPAMLLLLPLLAAFLLMVTALTYQFQGWLASLMANKRRRRTIIVLVTAALILIVQLPQLLNLLLIREGGVQIQTPEQLRQKSEQVERTARLVNLWLPPGWLPLGAMAAAEGDVLPALLGTLGLALIGTASLWRAYRTTLRLYTGKFTSGKKRPAPAAPPAKTEKRPPRLLEKDLPWLSEQAAAIALGGFRSLTRAPEVKMLLLTPVILGVIFGGMFLRGPPEMPEAVRPLLALGGMAMVLFTLVQLVGNQFGFDRNGFRVFVLCPARRRDILLGKNLAVAPLGLGLGLVAAVLVEMLYPMRLDYLLALPPQMVTMYLLFCLLANGLSILAPMRIAAGTLKPANTALVPILLQVAFIFLLPLALAPTLLPLGAELVLASHGWVEGVPVCLVLSLVECVAVIYVYRLVLGLQGGWLQARERKILNIVTTKAE
jgi:ABC-2 type transport system permease protein